MPCFPFAALTFQKLDSGQCVRQHLASNSKGGRSDIHALALIDRVSDGFNFGLFVHHDYLGNEPPRQAKNEFLEFGVSCWSTSAGTSWNPCILHPDDNFISANPTGVSQEAFFARGPCYSPIAVGCNLVNGRKCHHQGHGRHLLLASKVLAGADISSR